MKLPKNERELEDFVRIKGMRPVGYEEYKGQMIYLAETDLETDRKSEFPWGYYQVAWFVRPALNNSNFDGGAWLDFDGMHDMSEPEHKRHFGRLNAARKQAQGWIDESLNTQRYEKH